MVTLSSIEAAAARIGNGVRESSLIFSETASELTGNDIYLKLENLQITGAFKERGALNRLLTFTDQQLKRGVIAASAGNLRRDLDASPYAAYQSDGDSRLRGPGGVARQQL